MNDLNNGQAMGVNSGMGHGISADRSEMTLTSEGAQRQKQEATRNLSYNIAQFNQAGEGEAGIIQWATGGQTDFEGKNLIGDTTQLMTSDYIDALAASLHATFNSDDWKQQLHNTGLNVEFRPARVQATPITVHQLKNKTVHFDNDKRFISAGSAPADSIGSGVLSTGQAIYLKPAKKAVKFTASTHIYDIHQDTAGFTSSSLYIAVAQACKDMNDNLCDALVKVIDGSDAVKTVYPAAFTSKKPADIADELLDYVSDYLAETGFADEMGEIALILPKHLWRKLDRLAQRTSAVSVDALLGCTAMSYSADADVNDVFILPKRLVALSFRSTLDGAGDVVKVISTRQPKTASTEIEMFGVVDILCEGWTEVQADGSMAPAQLKHIVKMSIGGSAPVPLSLSTEVEY